MAVFTFRIPNGADGFDLEAVLKMLSDEMEGAYENHTSRKLEYTGATEGGGTLTLNGSGFVIDSEDETYLEGGRVTSISYVKGGVTIFTITGLSVDAATLIDAFMNDDPNAIWDAWDMVAAGRDTFTGTTGHDYIRGAGGDDTLNGGAGNDTLTGGAGNDTLIGGAGEDWMTGWTGNDTFNGTAAANDTRDYDMVSYIGEGYEFGSGVYVNMSARSVTVDGKTIAAGKAIDAFGNTDTLIDIEDVRATMFADYVNTGSTATEKRAVIGLAGNDTLVGGAGSDLARYDLDDNYSITSETVGDTTTEIREYTYLTAVQVTSAEEGYGVIANLTSTQITVNEMTLQAGEIKDTFGDIDKTVSIEKIYGTIFRDHMEGGDANNYFWGDEGNDTLIGGGGDDELEGGAGNDTLQGGVGDDYFSGGAGDDTIDGGDGFDDVDYSYEGNFDIDAPGIFVNLSGEDVETLKNGQATDTFGNIDTLTSIESVTGSAGNDTILAAKLSDEDSYFNMMGLGGDDTLTGTDGLDRLRYNRDAANGGEEIGIIANLTNDTITIAGSTYAAGTVRDGFGDTDTVSKIDAITATNYVDIIRGGTLDEGFVGLKGADDIDGGAGHDFVNYYRDNDNGGGKGVLVNLSAATVRLGTVSLLSGQAKDGFDTIDTLKNIEEVIGTAFTDTMLAGATDVIFNGMEGNDTLTGGAGHDTLDGGAGDDTLAGGAGNDIYVVDSLRDRVTETGTTAQGGIDTIKASITYTLGALASIENLTLTGTANINGTGNALDNTITGNDGNNVLNGGAGNDTLVGGKGNDTYVIDSGDTIIDEAGVDTVQVNFTHTLAAGLENLILTGTVAINGTGNDSDNVLTGNSAANVLTGGKGNDTYVIGAGDTIVEAGDGGTDTVQTAITYTLGNHLENLTLTGTGAINGTGNGLDNVLTGNSGRNVLTGLDGNDTLDGGIGADTLNGGVGDDTYIVDNAGDRIIDSSGIDTVRSSINWTLGEGLENLELSGTGNINGTGNASSNNIGGNDGNNLLNGGAGTDTLIGGKGNDTYVVDDTLDLIYEKDGEGIDTVLSSVSYQLSGETTFGFTENLTLTDTAAINGTGNNLANIITGNSAANILNGGAGHDTLIGGAGNDTLIGGEGNDTFVVDTTNDIVTELENQGIDTVQSSVTISLAANVENLTLTGSAAINGTGNDLNNVLTGNAGRNVLTGGKGDDTYVIGAGDTMVELENEGKDTVVSAATFTLANHFENLTLSGTANINGTGNAANNDLLGNSGSNILNGGAGDDLLSGGAGNDTLIGGAGSDKFMFSTALGRNNVDTIRDFVVGTDKILLDADIFKDIGDNWFHDGVGPDTAQSRILLSNGKLFYDADGTGEKAAVLFANVTFTGAVVLSEADFVII